MNWVTTVSPRWNVWQAHFQEALADTGPRILEVCLIPDESLSPKVAAIPQPDGGMLSMPLEDMSPLLPLETLEEKWVGGFIPPQTGATWINEYLRKPFDKLQGERSHSWIPFVVSLSDKRNQQHQISLSIAVCRREFLSRNRQTYQNMPIGF